MGIIGRTVPFEVCSQCLAGWQLVVGAPLFLSDMIVQE